MQPTARDIRLLPTLAAAVALVIPQGASATALRVPSQYPTIQAGLDAAAWGDTVLVAPGTYTDSNVRMEGGSPVTSCAFMADGVVLRSEGGPGTSTIDMLGAENGGPAAVVRARELPSTSTLIEGFTITGAPINYRGAYVASVGRITFRNCIFRDMDAGGSTGAGVAANGDVDIIDCEFVNCVGNSGGGLYHSNGHLNLIRTVFRECTNSAASLNGNTSQPPESALIEDCVFENNPSMGLGISTYQAGVVIRGCRFEANTSSSNSAGGLALGGPGSKLVEDCLFLNNATVGTAVGGGALFWGSGPCVVRRNTFQGNTQEYTFTGGAAVACQTAVTFENNVVTGTHSGQPAFRIGSLGSVTTSCNVYWDNDEGVGIPLSPTDREIDPLYCDPESGDFTVQENSPCVEPGALGCGQIGAFPAGCGIVSVESSSWSQIKDLYRRGETP